jgi:hypothetical protein
MEEFSGLLNVHRVCDVRQMEVYAAEPLVPEHSPFETEIVILSTIILLPSQCNLEILFVYSLFFLHNMIWP